MGLGDLVKPKAEDANEIDVEFVINQSSDVLPAALSVQHSPIASQRRERIVRVAQYFIWLSLNRDLSPSSKRDYAMRKVEYEMNDVDRKKLLQAVYRLYDGIAEDENALEQFEADLGRLSIVYEQCEEIR